jgi:hypothetical protein
MKYNKCPHCGNSELACITMGLVEMEFDRIDEIMSDKRYLKQLVKVHCNSCNKYICTYGEMFEED